ncbi:MAG: hypothetical protein ACTSPW_12695 [Promethearchaeota archaeon]
MTINTCPRRIMTSKILTTALNAPHMVTVPKSHGLLNKPLSSGSAC